MALLAGLGSGCGSTGPTAGELNDGREPINTEQPDASTPVAEPPADDPIEPVPQGPSATGRWGMTGFEDPVGVQLRQVDDALSGTGCAVGAPGIDDPRVLDELCGPLSGVVTEDGMSFSFSFGAGPWSGQDVVISEDAQRMTGLFGNAKAPSYSTWLRLEPDDFWLDIPTLSEEERLRLSLLSSCPDLELIEGTGDLYSPGVAYRFFVSTDGVGGDLGDFWISEFSLPTVLDDEIRVGPVAFTRSALPIELRLTVEEGTLLEVTAMMASGDEYRFDANAACSSSNDL